MRRHWLSGLAGVVVLALPACAGSGTDNGAPSPTVDDAAEVILAPLQTNASAPLTAETESPANVEDVAATTAASCAFEYNEATLAQRSWAFDGTLVAVTTGNDTRLDGVPVATFAVNHWYKGGTGDEITVQYELGQLSEFAPAAGKGTRLLVTGEPRWGGQPLDDAVAWGCGFTQPWTPTAAQTWSEAFGR